MIKRVDSNSSFMTTAFCIQVGCYDGDLHHNVFPVNKLFEGHKQRTYSLSYACSVEGPHGEAFVSIMHMD